MSKICCLNFGHFVCLYVYSATLTRIDFLIRCDTRAISNKMKKKIQRNLHDFVIRTQKNYDVCAG